MGAVCVRAACMAQQAARKMYSGQGSCLDHSCGCTTSSDPPGGPRKASAKRGTAQQRVCCGVPSVRGMLALGCVGYCLGCYRCLCLSACFTLVCVTPGGMLARACCRFPCTRHESSWLLLLAACACPLLDGWGPRFHCRPYTNTQGYLPLRAQHVVRGTAGCCLLAAAHGTHWCVPVGAWGAWFACTRVGGCCGDTHSGAGPILAALPAGSLVHTAGWLEGFRFAP
jgi:hypothetical protein